MSSPLRIQVAKRTAAVAAQLADLGRQTFHDTFAADNQPEDMAAYLAASFSPDIQLAELQQPEITFLLAYFEQELVGYAKLHIGSDLGLPPEKVGVRQLEIERLYVREDWIGTGLGASLMRRAIEEARLQSCRAVVLGVWEKNTRALAFYGRFGFKTIGQHTFALGTDIQQDLILRKGL
ncbi:GNAT family N-acetyltransferase [Hymenobacter guriensis]|uniref:GNAT family N-acetyltransferase n=1 Tax=Hymenobacter guriensis TaxID=2793065 RepID=A0ABS0L020_9BACT|nr:GNAT family N-acetyltransferase [Hymenobacter guriensis]MBG8553465.1 GNAT family N-acetyltransferase [Hymenobacter guriensis]